MYRPLTRIRKNWGPHRERLNHAFSSGEGYGLGELTEFYLSWHRYAGHTKSTEITYRRHLKLFTDYLQDQGHSLSISDLTPFDLIGHLNELAERGRAPSSLKSRHQHVCSFLKWAEGMGYISAEANPAHQVPTPKVPKIRKGFLKPEWFSALVDACAIPKFLGRLRWNDGF